MLDSSPLFYHLSTIRDTFLYAASVDSRGLDATVDILGEVVLRPQITDDELQMVCILKLNEPTQLLVVTLNLTNDHQVFSRGPLS